MGDLNKFFFFILFLLFIKNSIEQIIIPLTPNSQENEPTIVTRESFTVRGNDGTPITVTRINIRRNNLNGGDRNMQTPLDLMRLMDDRISSIFEEIISQRIGLKIMFNDFNRQEKEKEEGNKDEEKNDENKDEEQNKDEQNDNVDEKEFELDENKNDEENKDTIIEQGGEHNKAEENNKTAETKDKKKHRSSKVNKNRKEKREQKEKKDDDNKKKIGKLKVNPDLLKTKKRKKKLSQKKIIFSRICKYIFYSLILFTIYIMVKKLLELLEIIDPETNTGPKTVKINNNQDGKGTVVEDENKKKEEEDVIINKKKENKLN